MKLSDFKQQMNYQKSSSVEHFWQRDDQRRQPGRQCRKGRPQASKTAPKSEDEGTSRRLGWN